MGTATNETTATGGMTEAKTIEVVEYFGDNDIPDDGERYWVISPQAWTDLLSISAFSNADYVGSDDLPYKGGMVARRWQGFMFFMFSGNELTGSVRDNCAYHKSALGFASGQDVETHFDWVPEKAAHLANSFMSQGAVVIDQIGMYNARTTE
jgi:hypothetical protein